MFDAPETKARIDCLTAHLQRISRAVLQHQAEVLVVSIPHGPYVNLPAYNNGQCLGFAVNPAMLTSEATDTAFRRACDAAGVPFLAMTTGFREYKMERGLYFELDGDFTREGHMLYAQLVLPRLIEHLRVRFHDQKPVAALQKAIEGYRLFIKLAEQYADEEIRLTRRERAKRKRPGKPKPRNPRLPHN